MSRMPMQSPGRAAQHLQHILEAQSFMSAARFDIDAFMNDAVACMQTLSQASGAVIEMADGPEMVYRACSGALEKFVGFRLLRQGSLSGISYDRRSVMVSDDTQNDSRCNVAACKKINAQSMAVVPLMCGAEVVGVFKIISPNTHAFTHQNVQSLCTMASLVGDALGQHMAHSKRETHTREMREQAQYDALTGLPSRGLFNDRLFHAVYRAMRAGSLIGVFALDIDYFKSINTTYNREVGDGLLRAFAGRVGNLIGHGDTLARLDGDDFAIVMEQPVDAGAVAQAIVSATRSEFSVAGKTLHISASIGLCLHAGADVTPEELMRRANAALYDARTQGGNGFRVYKSQV